MTSEAKKNVAVKVPEQPKKKEAEDYFTLRNEKHAKNVAARNKK